MIPKVEDLKSCPMIHKSGDVFNPPGLTNFIGTVQVGMDITGISSLNFPPLSCSDGKTAGFFVNRKYFPSYGVPVTTTWFPDRIEREASIGEISFKSITILGIEKTAAMEEIRVRNRGNSKEELELKLLFSSGVIKQTEPWNNPPVPGEACSYAVADKTRKAFLFNSKDLSAFNLQGIYPFPDSMKESSVVFSMELSPGEEKQFFYVSALGSTRVETETLYDSLITSVGNEITETRNYWNEEIKAVFTPGNNRYSGSLPELETSDEEILKLYFMGILGVIYFKRDNPNSVYGRAYDTLMPKYWQTVTFLWDYSLSSTVHSLLDPAVMKKYLEKWMSTDIHKHFGTEYLTGGPVGPWYSVNDYAMTRMIRDYLCWTGNFSWLDEQVSNGIGGSGKVIDFLEEYATHWKKLKSVNGLADYGGINNLLECVSTYIHEVASLNAGNVYNMRTASEIFKLRGDESKSAEFIKEASALMKALSSLYSPGEGCWNVRYPDGRMIQSKHCYDFITILNTVAEDLPSGQKKEMCDFFEREMQSPVWMNALSVSDDNVLFSVRPDHQWNGAYPAWPAQAVSGMYAAGKGDSAFRWLKGLAKSANQGPFGQAHFTGAFIDTEDSGALKAANNEPYICDWTVSSGGSWVNIIIESIFGVKATLNEGITASPNFGVFDSEAELKNLFYQGKSYRVTRKGIS